MGCFKEIFAQAHLSQFITVVSFESKAPSGEVSLLPLMTDTTIMLGILPLPTSCDMRQDHQAKFITELTDLNFNNERKSPPGLKEIRITTTDIPYSANSLFIKLRELDIHAKSVQPPTKLSYGSLEELHITFHKLGIDLLKEFLELHEKLRQLHLHLNSN